MVNEAAFDSLLDVATANLITRGYSGELVMKARNMVYVFRNRGVNDLLCGMGSQILNDMSKELLIEVVEASRKVGA